MKVWLLHPQRDFEPSAPRPLNVDDLAADLELDTLFESMSIGDSYLADVSRTVVVASLRDPETIRFRQHVLDDCLQHEAVVRDIYRVSVAALERRTRGFLDILSSSPDSVLAVSLSALEQVLSALRDLRKLSDVHADQFASAGFTRFFDMVAEELNDEYLGVLEAHLEELRFRGGVLISAELGTGNKGKNYVLRRPRRTRRGWADLLALLGRSAYSFEIPQRDDSGARLLSELRGRGLSLVANAAAQSADHIRSFFQVLRFELGFYLACVNLQRNLTNAGGSVCFPVPLPPALPSLACTALYDPCLLIHTGEPVIANDITARGKSLIVITGANQGGKSTLLRSIGLAQLMMQCGMFVGALSFQADVCPAIVTHYKREEDPSMTTGKLDEELARMSVIADEITPHSLLLCNESFASTNAREGSQIGHDIVRAFVGAHVKVILVTHLFDLADSFHRERNPAHLFLRAERRPDGERTFRVAEGKPLQTSYGADLYRQVFGTDLLADPSPGTAAGVAGTYDEG